MICRYFFGVLALTAASCASNAPVQTTDPQQQATAETSWHCEDTAGTWSCKRRTISEIQERQAAEKARQYDWSAPQAPAAAQQQVTPASAPEQAAKQVSNPENAPTQAQPESPQNLPAYVRLMYQSQSPVSLEALPSSFWTVQIIALSSRQELKDFLADIRLEALTGARIRSNGRTFYVALLGVYENRAAAEQAARLRPEALLPFEPYIRSLGSLQEAMARASELPK